ncbi:MAG: S8 family serine peptidase [Clostridia bacterium]|nr:S8 family serine peptidase [Clostridia bacterium]
MKKRILALALSVMMIASLLPLSVLAADGDTSDGWYPAYFSETESEGIERFIGASAAEDDVEPEDIYDPTDVVRVSIILSENSTLDVFSPDNAVKSKLAQRYRTILKQRQNALAKKISGDALDGEKLDVVWNLTLAANIISANVEYGKIEKIKAVPGVEDVILETYYVANTDGDVGDAEPNMTISAGMTNTDIIWAEGYTGAGTSIAVIDTGIDYKHIAFDPDAYEYAIGTVNKNIDIVTREDVEAVFDQLNVKGRDSSLTVDDVYLNSKIPFAFNYVDNDTDIAHINDIEGAHGSHVAGIAAANRYVPDGNGGYADSLSAVLTQGQAPDAQLFVMKVFGKGGGTFESDYFAALEDAIVLGADSANLSLGSPDSGFSTEPEYKKLLEGLSECNTVVAISAGNNSYWSDETIAGKNYAEDKNLDTVGSPGSVTNSLSVASVDNAGIISPTIGFSGKWLEYTEPKGFTNVPFASLDGEYEFIYIDSIGSEEDFAAVADVLPGRIAICNRGTIHFSDKANAAVKYGAAATIICNHIEESISMDISDYIYTDPVIMLSLEYGEFIKENSEAVTDGETGEILYYTGKMTMPTETEVHYSDSDYYEMSDFSSWGVPGSLELKPEITAPGGNIYSVFGEQKLKSETIVDDGNDAFGLMSGTSMASPQVAGISALISEYIRDNDLEKKTGLTRRQLTTSLIMGCAVPLYDEDSGNYYPVIQQGAGLIDIAAAFRTHTYIMMQEDATKSWRDGKVKAEIGEVSRDTGKFDFTFDINNFGDEDSEYTLDAYFFTQNYVEEEMYDGKGNVICDDDGNAVTCLYMDKSTILLTTDVVWTVNGKPVETAVKYDFNGDGIFSYFDVQTLLEYIVENINDLDCIEYADVDDDGDIDTYDAYLALDMLHNTKITVPAGESVSVNVSVRLLDIDDFDINGAYIEGFVYAEEQATDEGAAGVTLSIPVLGYYGSWSDFSMFDHASAISYFNKTCGKAPYMAAAIGETSYITNTFVISSPNHSPSYAVGNPVVPDKEYHPERNAVSPLNSINYVKCTLIRNAKYTETVVTDSDGNELFSKTYGRTPAAFYSDDYGWSAYYYINPINYTPDTLEEGDAFTVTFRAIPEYYVKDGVADLGGVSKEKTEISQTFTIDGTAPKILSVQYHRESEKDPIDAIRVEMCDNQFTAAAVLLDEDGYPLKMIGSDPDADAKPGDTRVCVFDLNECFDDLTEAPSHFKISVTDYAMNDVDYKINFNEDELEEDRAIILNTDSVSLVPGDDYTFFATVTPWGENSPVLWKVEDEKIATVDDNGAVTAVAVGSTELTAYLMSDPEVTSSAKIVVLDLNKTLSGILCDENSDSWFVTFRTDDLPEYSLDSKTPVSSDFSALCYDVDGTLYCASLNDDWSSDIYTVNEDTYELTYLCSSEFGSPDYAAAPSFSEVAGTRLLAGISRTYLFWTDVSTGDIFTAYDYYEDIGDCELVGIAYAGSYKDSGYNIDVYYLIDKYGILYKTEVGLTDECEDMDPMFEAIDFIGRSVSFIGGQSLYLDTYGDLIWSRADEDNGLAQIIVCLIDENDNVRSYYRGEFETDIWPVSGIYEKGASIAFDYQSNDTEETSGKDKAVKGSAISPMSVTVSDEPKNVKNVSGGSKSIDGMIIDDYVYIDIIADIEATNGLYTVEYNASVYEVLRVDHTSECFAVSYTDGMVKFAFADTVKYAPEEYIATVVLKTVGDGDRSVAVTTEEQNNDHPGTTEYLYKSIDLKVVPGARVAAYDIDNEAKVINITTKKDQPLSSFQLKLNGVPQTAFTLTPDSFGENQIQIKGVRYSEETNTAGIRYFISYSENGFEQSFKVKVTDSEGYDHVYTVNVTFDHTPACTGITPGYTANSGLTVFDGNSRQINVVSKANSKEVSFKLNLKGGAAVSVISDAKPHIIQTPDKGATYVEVSPDEINSSAIVYFKCYRAEELREFDIGIIYPNGIVEPYHVVVTFA